MDPTARSIPASPSAGSLAVSLRDGPLLVTVVAVGLGIWIDRSCPLSAVLWCVLSAGFLVARWLAARRGRDRAAAMLVLLAALSLGGLWHHCRWYLFRHDDLARYAAGFERLVHVKATLRSVPRWRPQHDPSPFDTVDQRESTWIALDVIALQRGGRWQAASGRATLVVDGRLRDYLPGDQVQFSASLRRLTSPLNPGELDYAATRRQVRELCRLYCRHPDAIRLLKRGSAWQPRRSLGRVQLAARDRLHSHVRRQSGLACAMVLGVREQMDPKAVDDFYRSGAVHVLAVSGLHLGILAYCLWTAMRTGVFPQRLSLVCIVALVIAYAALTGGRPPVVRAAILVTVFAAARWLGRRAFSHNSLGAAAMLTLAWNPAGLFDTGTQLSFLAVATIFAWVRRRANAEEADPLRQLIWQSRPLVWRLACRMGMAIGRACAVTALVWAVTLPLVAARFHLVAPIGVLVNPLLWFPVALALLSGFGVLAATVFCPPLTTPLGWICDQAFACLHGAVQLGAAVPNGHWWVCGPPTWWVVGFYAWTVIAWVIRSQRLRAWPLAMWLAWLGVACLLTAPVQRQWRRHVQDQLTVCFVAVGHGTSVLLELPDGRTILYDAGRLGTARSAARPICALLWSRRVRRLDAVILSHADADHFNAVPALLERFSVGTVYVSPPMFRSRSPAVIALRDEIARQGVPVGCLQESRRIAVGPRVALDVLHPPPQGCEAGDNADSIVLAACFGGRRVLLPGDLESVGLDELLAERPLSCDVLMAPHHGSPHSRPERVLRWSSPRLVVISGGAGKDVEQVAKTFSQTGSSVWHTQQVGVVTVEITERSIRRSIRRR